VTRKRGRACDARKINFGDPYPELEGAPGQPQGRDRDGAPTGARSGPAVVGLKYQQAFDWKVSEKEEAKMKVRKLARLQNLAASMNLQLVPLQ